MQTERVHRAWHIAGYAYAAHAFEVPIHKLSIDGFTEVDLAERGTAQRLDGWTMLRTPECFRPVGSFEHTNLRERIVLVALAGPIQELLHRGRLCTLKNVQEFTDDWRQVWQAAGALWPNEQQRVAYLWQQIARGAVFFHWNTTMEFVNPVAERLLRQGALTGVEVQEMWTHYRAKQDEGGDSRPRSRNRPRRSSDRFNTDWDSNIDEDDPDFE